MSSERGLRAAGYSRQLEVLTGAALFLLSAGWVWWQNRRVAVLWDLSYLLDSAWRFSLGQVPYRELPFAHAPLTFLIHAVLIRVFGRVYWPHAGYAVVAGGCGTLLSWWLLRWVLEPLGAKGRLLAAILAVPLIPLGVYGIYPHPIYDSDAILAVLLALALLQQALGREWSSDESAGRGTSGRVRAVCLVAGASCVIPIFFKQNIGGPFLLCVLVTLVALLVQGRVAGRSTVRDLWVAGGVALGIVAALVVVQAAFGLRNYTHWTVEFAAQRRLPGLAVIATVYQQSSLRWALPCAGVGVALLYLGVKRGVTRGRKLFGIVSIVLMASPFLWTVVSFWVNDDPDDRADQFLSLWAYVLLLAVPFAVAGLRRLNLRSALPWILLGTIHGTFLSQQLWGSTYAIWPLFLLLIAGMLLWARTIALPLATLLVAVLTVSGGIYAASLERLSYIHLDGERRTSSLPSLRGMITPGPWLPGLDELVRFADQEIPADEPVLLIPGEDPFFFATGRVPLFPVLLFDLATYPYSPEETLAEARRSGVQWLIFKRETQLTAEPYQALPAITAGLMPDFVPYRKLTLYDVYKRR